METITEINLSIDRWDDKYEVCDGEDSDYTADTLAEAYLYLAKALIQKGEAYYKDAMAELQTRINRVDPLPGEYAPEIEDAIVNNLGDD